MNNSKTLADFGQTVVRLRQQAGLTQSALAERCTKYKNQVASIEAGMVNPTLSMILVLAKALGVTPATLVGGSLDAADCRPAALDA